VSVYLFLRILLFLYKNPEISLYVDVDKKPKNVFIRTKNPEIFFTRIQKTQKYFYTYTPGRCCLVFVCLPASVLLLIQDHFFFYHFSLLSFDLIIIRIDANFHQTWHGSCFTRELFISSKEIAIEKNFGELFLQAVKSDDILAGVLVWQERNAKRNETTMNEVNFDKRPCESFPIEIRNYAANTLVDALLASCESQDERIELSVNLLGFDPRC
jgi:hypothetical protein